MTLSEELIWRGFTAETTIKDPKFLDTRKNKQFYCGADPSADSLTIGNLATLMMCACFIRHGYKPTFLVGGATGQIGDPKETGERDLKSLDEVAHNKACIKAQIKRIIKSDDLDVVDNLDWFKSINYLDFLREIGKNFSMTQLLDRQFVQARIGAGGSGISYAEFSYTLIQGYDFLHLYRTKGIDLQLCGADQYGNCTSGIHLIRRLENTDADVWSSPLVIDPVTGRKFGKSEGNAVWLAAKDTGSGNYTTIFDFYQSWLNQPDASLEYLLKLYTFYDREAISNLLAEHAKDPAKRLAQKALAREVTTIVHGADAAKTAEKLTSILFESTDIASDLDSLSVAELDAFADNFPCASLSTAPTLLDALVATGLASSKNDAKKLLSANAISLNGKKTTDNLPLTSLSLLKKGKNKFALIR